ncbi:MAG TPA: integrase family protein [Methylophilaceae bacterium]|jgi:integrase
MADKLTKTFIDNIPYPETGQKFYRDSQLTGFGVRVGTGSKVYYAEGKVNDKTVRVTIGRHGVFAPEQARLEAKSILGQIARGVNPNDLDKAKKAKSVTLSQVYEAYKQARNSLKPRTIYDYDRFMKTHFLEWNNKPIVDISKDMIEKKHRGIGERSEAQANLSMRFMRALFNFALGQYEDSIGNPIIADNPIKRLSQTRAWYRVDRKQTVIKAHDLPAWFKAVNALPEFSKGINRYAVKDYLLLLIFTGLRREEGLALQWRDVDLKAKTLTIPDPKNRQAHTLPLSDFLFELLKKRSKDNIEKSPFVFAGRGVKGYMDDPNKQMKIVVEKSGVIFTPHDLRRTFITVAESLDISAYALKRLANHKMNNDVTAGYIIGDAERLRAPMQRITDYFKKNGEQLE